MNRSKPLTTLVIRFLIVMHWALILLGILYLPIIFSSASSQQNKQTLDVFCWPDLFLTESLEKFEKETGIRVICHYYATNEELITKLKAMEGKGFDLIFPSDYAVAILKKAKMLKKLDHTKLSFLPQISSKLTGFAYDPSLCYSVPYQWEPFVFGINRDAIPDCDREFTWGHVFEKGQLPGKIAMSYDPIEAISFVSHYLFGPVKTLTNEQKKQVKCALKKQKEWVGSYSSLRGDYFLATKNCSLAVCLSSHLFRGALTHPHIDFAIPTDGTIISIENAAIPIGCAKEESAYSFLEFLYSPEELARSCNNLFLFPATEDAIPLLDVPPPFLDLLNQIKQQEKPLYFIKPLLSEREARDLWIQVR